jgi:hypothetical protein
MRSTPNWYIFVNTLLYFLQDIFLDYIQAGMKTKFKTEKPFWVTFTTLHFIHNVPMGPMS